MQGQRVEIPGLVNIRHKYSDIRAAKDAQALRWVACGGDDAAQENCEREGGSFHESTSRSWRSARFNFSNLFQALAQTLFEALVGRLVVGAAGEIVGEAGHVGDFIIEIVSVLVAFAVADVFHETGDGVAEVEGDGISFRFADVFQDSAVAGVESI